MSISFFPVAPTSAKKYARPIACHLERSRAITNECCHLERSEAESKDLRLFFQFCQREEAALLPNLTVVYRLGSASRLDAGEFLPYRSAEGCWDVARHEERLV